MKKNIKYLLIFVFALIGGSIGSFAYPLFQSITHSSSTSSSLISNNTYDNQSSVTQAVDKVKDAVVSVINYQKPSNASSDTELTEDGLAIYGEGSGIIYKKENGKAYVVTNEHVVNGAKSLEVQFSSGDTVKATLVGSDSYSDLAVLEISDEKVTTVAEFANSDTIKVGETALAIGSPLGVSFANSVTKGIVSGVNRQITGTNDNGQTVSINAIQTDAAINPGNSGGALINIEGQVIGINEQKVVRDSSGESTVEGLGFAIPSNDVVTIIEQLETNKKVVRPALGITMKAYSQLTTIEMKKANLENSKLTSGVVVMSVLKGLPADGQLQEYDVITGIDDQEVKTTSDLQNVLYRHKVGDSVVLKVVRNGEEKNVTIKLTKTTDQLNLENN
ncbi:S1C family serine protease [Streptococcus sp. DD13]|uniref:S1C family serine protease n=1 Tax=Streptococcus sp. DD13 TaxID=1777881 RepID=UPI000796BBF5|nr:trypsin-like peptidase domain-containing protein [Streptococcus sp. DD13]KXT77773.1 Serine protease, DegP/HtrA, do-like protein [Streptococcus sp. DD13]